MAQGYPRDEEAEWEYEYDPTETEDFYVTVDLTDTVTARKNAIKNPVPEHKPRRRRARKQQMKDTAIGNQDQPVSSAPDAAAQAQDGAEPAPTPDEAQQSTERPSNDDQRDRIQILDFHGPNPLISYQDQLYSCRWASSIGTDLFFTKSSDAADRKVLRSLATHDLLGISSARLVATTAHLQPRQSGKRQRQDEDAEQPDTTAGDHAGGAASTLREDETAKERQARFLERLNAAKARRIEKDRGGAAPEG